MARRNLCTKHARRKFYEIHVIHASPTTTEALARIGALYAIEDEVRGKPIDLRLSVRQARAKPLLHDLRRCMEKALHSLSAKSETAAAIRYGSPSPTPGSHVSNAARSVALAPAFYAVVVAPLIWNGRLGCPTDCPEKPLLHTVTNGTDHRI
ncbi:MAG TPA: transposase [Edaphobacter sp.]|nr:transposase [Edaphobacter sp.]